MKTNKAPTDDELLDLIEQVNNRTFTCVNGESVIATALLCIVQELRKIARVLDKQVK